jgi:pyruvate/2-oxoglutarate dehydrogenase complex dihydrolipoamide dehydrogenase (E3) component
MAQWRQLIDDGYGGRVTGPIMNIDESRGCHYDAIFLGGGSAGRFGAAVLRSLGGRALVLERWPFLGGSCPHQACVPHHLFSEAAKELDQAQALAGRLWYGKFDPDAASILELVELFRAQRSGPPLPMAEGSMIYGFTMPERTGFQKCVIDARSRRVLGVHHAGYGAKDAFQYLHHLISRPGGLTIDELGDMNELYLSPDYFIGYARLRSGQADLTSI